MLRDRCSLSGKNDPAPGKAGFGLQTYYPISRATDESIYLEENQEALASEC
jgi:hypothetical protein